MNITFFIRITLNLHTSIRQSVAKDPLFYFNMINHSFFVKNDSKLINESTGWYMNSELILKWYILIIPNEFKFINILRNSEVTYHKDQRHLVIYSRQIPINHYEILKRDTNWLSMIFPHSINETLYWIPSQKSMNKAIIEKVESIIIRASSDDG